jgi:hypothetical protein
MNTNTHTEEQAMKKYCPHNHKTCVGRTCAVWMWTEKPPEPIELSHPDKSAVDPTDRPPEIPASYVFYSSLPARLRPAFWREPEAETFARWRGYCGLTRKHEIGG